MKAGEEGRLKGVERKWEMQEEVWRETEASEEREGSGKGLRRKGEKRSHLKVHQYGALT